ncbi:MAG: type VI secretion system baseplate subunit TssG [Candidatus Methylumidiphilus sp.]
MADQDRTPTHALIAALRQEPWRFDFFQAMRLLECHYADQPRLGTALKAADDPLRLAQAVELDFPPSALAAWEAGEAGHPDRLLVRFLGLFGAHGPLPLHLTEYARERIHHHGDHTFARFADIFHHRMLCLFYRAWADTQPTVQFDRPGADRFAVYLGSLFGIGMPAYRDRDAMPDRAKLLFAGHLACQTQHADGLCAIIGEYFGVATAIVEFVGEWMDIAQSEQTRLGVAPHAGALGLSTVLGARVYGCQHKFRVVLGPLDLPRYLSLLPGQPGLAVLAALVRNYTGDELAWDVNLVLRRAEVPALRLDGGAQLGWTSWLGEKPKGGDADDLTLNPFFRA